ncbi:MAG: 5-formyltetrahydrofolate cyclo-ligase [Bacteroidota bacterium]|nr:5-formyltetrahydrofolate cyclo-ligase [Bacteroidota bacterium]
MTKAAIRNIYKEKRKQLSIAEVVKLTDLILINFQKINLPFISFAHTYIASEKLGEIDTLAITRYLEFKNPGLKILVPRIDRLSGSMHHLHYNDEVEFEDNAFGIPEPTGGEKFSADIIDLVLIPLLAFDKQGNRVGYGKGFYDKFLSECNEEAIKIGLSFFEPEAQIDDINQYDIPLNYCVTPQHVFDFTGARQSF